ncbi:hypothetical protein C0J50_9363 [Silurus asotus]|uniref:Gypsy retrotransposon integrase-like protein 1 n=1 Tax=Silurus asotus TaxID=30991 RepID=A0AAD5A5X5_SILAS|nr:hypothetical protein C0J50_9363 [Silurus asotus]
MCEFHCSEIQFLGYVIDAAGIRMDERKVAVVRDWPVPASIKQLQRFLGFANFYGRFIGGFSLISAPLTSLLRGKAKTLSWTPEAQRAFEELRKRFCAAPLLRHPDPQLSFVVKVNASSTGPEEPAEPRPILPPALILSPIVWHLDEAIRTATRREPAPPGCPRNRTFVPRECQQALLKAVHEVPGSGHPGRRQTLRLVQGRYWWPGISNTVPEFVRGCNICAISKTPRHLPLGKLIPLPTSQRPWSHIGIDFVTDLPRSEGFTCILVVVDRFSKACRFVPLRGLPMALETAEALFHHVFRNFGLLEEIVSDRGSQFTSHIWRAFFQLLGVTVNLSSGYHPQSNGQTKLGRYLRTYCHQDQREWSRFLPWAEYAQNSLRQDTTGLTPFQCVLGFQPPLFPWSDEPSNVPAVDHWFWESIRTWEAAHTQLRRAIRETRRHADARRLEAPSYSPGDWVWLSTKDLRLRLPCRKLSPRYIGPFRIERRINEAAYRLELPPRYRIHPTFHVLLLKPYTPSSAQHAGEVRPPPPEVLEQPSVYPVREVLDSRRRGSGLEYLVDWEGYGPEEWSWVARRDILDPALLEECHATHPLCTAPRG